MKLNNMYKSLDYDLQDPEYVAIYLIEGSPKEFYLALRNVMRANQGMSENDSRKNRNN
ncbi:MAG: hypothetical protein QNJ37_07895 [Crocosphaera sp.]|nr:hypothetical protein [Crocosphaera sp.]